MNNLKEEKEQLKVLYLEMYQYMIKKDTINLDKILDNSFVLLHMTGVRQIKSEYLSHINEGILRYYSENTEHININIDENRAEIIGQSRVNASVFGSGRHTWSLQLRIKCKKINEKWLMTQAVASTYY
ncbi:nuclear transport factor 2 family protein [Terrisporobacter sp.]